MLTKKSSKTLPKKIINETSDLQYILFSLRLLESEQFLMIEFSSNLGAKNSNYFFNEKIVVNCCIG